MTTKNMFKRLSLLLALTVAIVSIFATGLTASAAYVTDGNSFYTAGDVDENDLFDIRDLVAANYQLGNKTAADLDGDGTIGSYDLALIRALILGIDNSEWTK